MPDGPVFFFHHSGHVSGVDDADYDENGNNPLIATYWGSFDSGAPFSVAKDYQWGGIVGTLGELPLIGTLVAKRLQHRPATAPAGTGVA